GPEHEVPTWGSLGPLRPFWNLLTQMLDHTCPFSCLSRGNVE
ncbi:hypothetical protein CSUI_009622, partial [Cystoisospora suis]